MRTLLYRLLTTAVAALLLLTGRVAAQDKPTPVLNNLEVRQLVARAEPSDNLRLAAHFSALADRYTAETKRHTAMAHSFVGNARGTLGPTMSVHCKRLADLNTTSANTARELAGYHITLVGGTAATPPAGAAEFQAGKGAPPPTDKELNALAARANTAAEHRGLLEYFSTLAKRYATEANEHVALAQAYRGGRLATAAVHHDALASSAREAAKEATAAAEMHKGLANVSHLGARDRHRRANEGWTFGALDMMQRRPASARAS